MIRHAVLLTLLVSLLVFMAGCKGDTGPAGPSLKGNIYGACFMVDLTTVAATNNSGIVVSVEGKNFSATTDSAGKFVLVGVPIGVHTITFSKAGYGVRKYVGQQFAGGGDIWWGTASIYALPTFSVDSLMVTASPGTINVSGKFAGTLPAYNRFGRIFISTTPTVSPNPSNYLLTLSFSVSPASTTFILDIPTLALGPSGIVTGQTIYMVVYAESVSPSSYVDFPTGRLYYPNLSSSGSPVVSVVVP